MLERDVGGNAKVLRAERFPEIDPRFIGVEAEENKAFLIRGREGSPTVLADTTTRDGVTGHLDVYQRLIPPEMGIVYLPTTETISNMTTLIRQSVNHFPLLMLQGGEDPGPEFQTHLNGNSQMIARYGGINPVRDRVNKIMVEEAKKHGHKVLILGICRGLELLAVETLIEASSRHYPKDIGVELIEHPIVSVFPHSEMRIPLRLDRIEHWPGNHHLQVRELPQQMIDEGWVAYYEDPVDGGLEIMVRLDRDGNITAILTQGHPERFPGIEGLMFRRWIHSCIRAHWQRYHN